MQRRTIRPTLAGAACAALLLTGCASAGGEPATGAASSDDTGAGATHVMPDGTVMSGEEHGAHDDGGGHEGGHDHGEAVDSYGPSETASMICGGQVADDVRRLTGVDALPEPSTSWQAPMFTCTFELPAGPLVLTVHDTDDLAEGDAHFEARRAALAPTRELKGMYGLGLPAFETARGTAAFIRDGKTLEVDATALPTGLGPDGSLDQADLAYAVATSVLACWTAHD